MSNAPTPHVYFADKRPNHRDLQALAEFLRHASQRDEKDLQHLLEKHPAIVGVLGFCEFTSEHPLYKPDENNRPILDDGRRRDRADLIAAMRGPLTTDRDYRSAHVLELKQANFEVAERAVGSRPSRAARDAVAQLREYSRWLTELDENKRLLKRIGWDVRIPTLTLIMGRDDEFGKNPGQKAELKGELQRQGVTLLTVDDLFQAAQERASLFDMVSPAKAYYEPRVVARGGAYRLMIESDRFSPTDLFSYPKTPHSRKHGPAGYRQGVAYLPWLRDEFDFRCVYCLKREQWGQVTGEFGIDHFEPQTRKRELGTDYDNLLYACHRCGLSKGDRSVDIPSALDLRPHSDGSLEPLTPEGERIINVLDLNSSDFMVWRGTWMRLAELALSHDEKLYQRLTGWPDEPPDLALLHPPDGNVRPEGIVDSCFAHMTALREFTLAE